MELTRDPIPQLIRKIAVPASIGIFFQTMYNVVDTWFAGLISTHALAALSLSFPIFFILIALGSGISQGSTALIANSLGEGDHEKAQHYSLQAISFGVSFAILLAIFGFFAAPSAFQMLGADGEYLRICLDYMNVILCGTVFILLQSILNASLNAIGDTRTFRDLLIAGFVLNCLLDPWFMYGGAGLPALGIRGIALATVLIQVFSCCYLIYKLRQSRLWEGVDYGKLKPQAALFRDIAAQGFPASINMVTVAVGIFVITWFVSQFNVDAGVAAYGIATRVEQIALMPTIGLNIAVLSLTGQNNGARRFDRIREAWKQSLVYGLIMMATGGVLIYLFAEPLMAFFTSDSEVVRIGSEYLRIASITLCSYVILFQTVYLLQGLKKPMYAIWIGLYRQILAPCLVFWLLAFQFGWELHGIWWGVFLVTWSAAIVTFFYGRWKLNQVELTATPPADSKAEAPAG